eukprot:scaffold96121_cov57-Phaeocystis_antarctica.AAC.3
MGAVKFQREAAIAHFCECDPRNICSSASILSGVSAANKMASSSGTFPTSGDFPSRAFRRLAPSKPCASRWRVMLRMLLAYA